MGLFDFWRSKRKKSTPAPTPAEVRENLRKSLKEARAALALLLPGRRAALGPLAKGKDWQLTKTNEGLYRLEGSDLALTISTEPFLMQKDGKLQGLLHLPEVGLARALKAGRKEDFLSESRSIRAGAEHLRAFLEKSPEPARPEKTGLAQLRQELAGLEQEPETPLPQGPLQLQDTLQLPPILLEGWLARLGPSLVAHVLLASPADLEEKVLAHLSLRFQLMVKEELEALCGPAREWEQNPHNQRLPLLDNDRAVAQALDKLGQVLAVERLRRRS